MCVVSMIMQHFHDKWEPLVPHQWVFPVPVPRPMPAPAPPMITPQEVDEFRRLLERAREYDRKNGEPDCELDEKRQALKKLAEQLGVDIAFVGSPQPAAGK